MGKDRKTQRLCFKLWPSWQKPPSYLRPNFEFEGYTSADIDFFDKNITKAVSQASADTPEVQFRVERMVEAWKYVQTILLSKVKYFDTPPNISVDSAAQNQAAIFMAKDIAKIRADRQFYASKMRQYPHINFRMKQNHYWRFGWALTLFIAERTLLDELCTAITTYTKNRAGQQAAQKFWQNIGPSDNLWKSAQTQLYMLNQTNLTNVLVNGDFEDGTTNGWTVSGSSSIAGKNINGKYAIRANKNSTLTQSMPVGPHQRYRLTAMVKYIDTHNTDAPSVETGIAFYQNSPSTGALYPEPMRNTLSTGAPADGWKRLRRLHLTIC